MDLVFQLLNGTVDLGQQRQMGRSFQGNTIVQCLDGFPCGGHFTRLHEFDDLVSN